ncbi:MAG TPA: S8 family serine peptidase, partial [Pyrinomonadaceae bacterium]|nr:S8 family serine peptidase [Pyrinomonadaceae bacterium]
MKNPKKHLILTGLALLSLLLSLCAGRLTGDDVVVRAQLKTESGGKVSPALLARMRDAQAGGRIQVIVQPRDAANASLDLLLRNMGARIKSQLRQLNLRVIELPADAVVKLAARREIRYVSLDDEIKTFGHVTTTSGADAANDTGLLTTGGLDGTGIGIAIIDSGIDTNHRSFTSALGLSRVQFSRDFTGEGRTDDPYGHGTHVASASAGNGQVSSGQYKGIASNAQIINLRVLNAQGTGTASALLGALDWVLSYRNIFNIRVVNMSLGMTAVDSYKNDPVCRAVRRLVDSGVVVLAAAGNNGKDSSGNKIYGQIHSPGNEPSAITVGAANTFGTDARGDDAVASYSSRGPTRSFLTDENDLRHYDNLIKPDIVAPGNKLIYAEAFNNHLVTAHPELDAGASSITTRKMMYMSGSSMATPVAAGAAALLLQANPSLTPNLVKMILMYTSQPLAGYNQFEQGAGELNIEGAVRLAKLVRPSLSLLTLVGDPLLTTLVAPVAQTTIAGQTFAWSQGIILNRTYATGTNLITKYQKIYGAGALLG